MTPKERKKLRNILALLDPESGESVAALNVAALFLKKRGLTFQDLVSDEDTSSCDEELSKENATLKREIEELLEKNGYYAGVTNLLRDEKIAHKRLKGAFKKAKAAFERAKQAYKNTEKARCSLAIKNGHLEEENRKLQNEIEQLRKSPFRTFARSLMPRKRTINSANPS